ncbi:MAG TPA: RDD family protein [Ornithinibacter sp.]|nr:RDD family protein [Ornithinibacter sp.]
MTDQPYDPAEPTPDEPTAPPAAPTAPPTPPAAAAPPVPPAPPQAPPPQAAPYGAPPVPPPYGGPPAPAANPYGGYSQAPVYAGGGGPAYPGSLAYVEQNFGKVADFGQRALAYLIDTALTLIGLVPVVIGIIVLTVGASNSVTTTTDDFGTTISSNDFDPTLAVVGGLLIALGAVISIGITIWNRIFKMGRTGQSVGKKVIGLYLLDDKTGQPIGAGMCFLRELVQSLVNQIVYLGWLWMLWDADKQTLGDKSVHSNVVVLPKT